jgi:mRNA-degrading endonuclease RelE of RelBE toxin-antitoxin system
MTYSIRYRTSAKKELHDCCAHHGDLLQKIGRWLDRLAREAEDKTAFETVDAREAIGRFLGELAERGEAPSKQLEYLRRRWEDASLLDKLRAFWVFLKKRRAPWEFRYGSKPIRFLGACECEIDVYYEVDHVKRQVVFVKFDGLPTQASPR